MHHGEAKVAAKDEAELRNDQAKQDGGGKERNWKVNMHVIKRQIKGHIDGNKGGLVKSHKINVLLLSYNYGGKQVKGE